VPNTFELAGGAVVIAGLALTMRAVRRPPAAAGADAKPAPAPSAEPVAAASTS
jgi:hypothetical protein